LVFLIHRDLYDGAPALSFFDFEGFRFFRVINKEVVDITGCVDLIHWSVVVYMFAIWFQASAVM